MHDRPDSVALDRWARRCAQLYTLPAIAVRVLELTSDPRVDVDRLTRCIEQDPAITAKVLRVVNSSLFGLGTRVADLHQAVALLGIKPLKLLVLGFSLPPQLTDNLGAVVLGRYWQQALLRAAAAREFCQRALLQPGDEAFVAGLLADVGQLALFQELGEPYLQLLGGLPRSPVLLQSEAQSLGFNHRQLTVRLLHDWKLPESLVEIIASLSEGSPPAVRSAGPSMLECVYLADRLARALDCGEPEEMDNVLALAIRYLHWTRGQVEELIEELRVQVGQLAESLAVQLPGGLNYREVMDEAHRQLVDAAADAAAGAARQQQEVDILEQLRALSALAGNRIDDGGTTALPQASRHAHTAGAAPALKLSTARETKRAIPPSEPGGDFVAAVVADETTAPVVADPGLVGRLTSELVACRQNRCALSLLLVAIDHWGEVVFSLGPGGATQLLQSVEKVCQQLDASEAFCMQASEARLAVALPGCDRLEAAALGNQLLRHVRQANSGQAVEWSVSVGVSTIALPPPNFTALDLLESAARCLNAAQMTGGNTLKSIENF